MERSKVEQFITENANLFEESKLQEISAKLESLPEEKATKIMENSFKVPGIGLALALLFGMFAFDRFWMGKTGTGIVKLLTVGGFGIWYILDLFKAKGNVREVNTEKIMDLIEGKED